MFRKCVSFQLTQEDDTAMERIHASGISKVGILRRGITEYLKELNYNEMEEKILADKKIQDSKKNTIDNLINPV